MAVNVKSNQASKTASKTKAKSSKLAKSKTQSEAEQLVADNAEMLVAHQKAKAEFNKLDAEYKTLCAKLTDLFIDEPGETVTITTDAGTLVLGAQRNSTVLADSDTVVDMLEEIEEGLALKLAKFGVTDVKKHVPASKHDAIMHSEYSGNRSVKSFTPTES